MSSISTFIPEFQIRLIKILLDLVSRQKKTYDSFVPVNRFACFPLKSCLKMYCDSLNSNRFVVLEQNRKLSIENHRMVLH